MTSVLGGLVVSAAVVGGVVLLTPTVVRRFRTPTWLAAAALTSIGLVLGLTLGVRLFETTSTRVGVGLPQVPCLDAGDCVDRIVELDAMWWSNVALFAPAGFLVTLVVGRPSAVLLGLVACSLVVELLQGITGLGAPDPGDLVANSLGSAIGVGLGIVALRPGRRSPDGSGRPVPAVRRAGWVAGGVVAVLVVWLAVVAGADARRAALARDVREAFAGTTVAEISAWMATPEGAEQVFAATGVRPSYVGEIGATGVYEARFSTQFFGLDRCVFARWDAAGLTVVDGAGGDCTEFRDRPPAELPDR